MSFQYIFKGQTHTNTDREYMLNIGMDTEQIESVLQQQEYELATSIVGKNYSTMTDAAYISKGLLVEEEYRLAKTQAEKWITDGKPSQVPDAVQSWADAAGMTPEEAAGDIATTALSWEGVLATRTGHGCR